MDIEVWKDVPGYEGEYQSSSLGRIKSLKFNKEKILKQSIMPNGYLFVTLSRDNIKEVKNVHQIIAMSFLNHKPNKWNIVVDHLDNIRSNNKLDNLQLVPQRENCWKDRKSTSSKYIGVYWNKSNNCWTSSIKVNGKNKIIGSFDDEEIASKSYISALENLKLGILPVYQKKSKRTSK